MLAIRQIQSFKILRDFLPIEIFQRIIWHNPRREATLISHAGIRGEIPK